MSIFVFSLLGGSASAQSERLLLYFEVQSQDIFFRIGVYKTIQNAGITYVTAEKHPYGIGRFATEKIILDTVQINSFETKIESLSKEGSLSKESVFPASDETRFGIFEVFPKDAKVPLVLRSIEKTKIGNANYRTVNSPTGLTFMNQFYEMVFATTQKFYNDGPNPKANPFGAALLIPDFDDTRSVGGMAVWCSDGPMNIKLVEPQLVL